MTKEELIKLGVNDEVADKVMKIYVNEIIDGQRATVRADYILYYKELLMKKKINELKIAQYTHDYDFTDITYEPELKEKARLLRDLEVAKQARIKRAWGELDEMLTNYATTFNDVESRIFSLLYLKCWKVKDVAISLNLSENYIRHKKMVIDRDLKILMVDKKVLVYSNDNTLGK